jgi:hypothetical protein
MIGVALLRSGDIRGGVDAVRDWPAILRSEPDEDSRRLTGSFESLLNELDGVLVASSATIPGLPDNARLRLREAVRLAAGGAPEQASYMLDNLAGALLWLLRTHPDEVVIEVHAEVTLALGVTATHGNRLDAARRGLQHAQSSSLRWSPNTDGRMWPPAD